MKLKHKPNRWSCLATAFAMALDIPVFEFFELVGHDGSEILYPELPEPIRRAGIHIQEAVEVCWKLGRSATPIELFPTAVTEYGQTPRAILFPLGNWERFQQHLADGTGVIECETRHCGHAVAFNRGTIYDPDGRAFAYSRDTCEARGLFTKRLWRLG